jgi:hypothetical protein
MLTRGDEPDRRATTGKRVRRAHLVALLAVLAVLLAGGPAAAAGATLGEWRFDEPAGDVALDAGPHGLDGRLGEADGPDSADPARIPGAAGGALRFDGASFVRLPDADELSPETLTTEAVVRAPASPGSYRYLISRGGRGCFAGAYGLYTGAAGGIAFYVFDGSRFVVSATARASDVWDGSWHHVAGTFDGQRVRVYVDGSPVGDPSDAVMQIDYVGTSERTAFGRYVGSCDLSFTGDMDLVRLRNGALQAGALVDAARHELQRTPSVDDGAPLPAAAPPTTIPAEAPRSAPPSTPSAPARACTLTVSRNRIVVRRSTAITVRVTVRGRPAGKVRVSAHQRGRRKPVAVARTSATGRARLVIRAHRRGEVKVRAAVRPTCSARVIRVARPG